MARLRFEQAIEGMGGYQADATLGPWVFEVKRNLRDVRSLRDALQQMALIAASRRERHTILVLDRPSLTAERVHDEWQSFKRILREDLGGRIVIVGEIPGFGLEVLAGDLPGDFKDWKKVVHQILQHEDESPSSRRPSAFFDVLRILLVHWLRGEPPLSTKQLTEETGFSYPTIAASLEKLGDYLVRGSNRSVGFRRFPLEPWKKLLVDADTVRLTQRYAAEGRPRSPEAMLGRLRELGVPEIAVGGVLGARHWYPGIDLAGTPRLDLTVNFGMQRFRDLRMLTDEPTLDFIRKLDPALRPVGRSQAASLVVHGLFTSHALSQTGNDGTVWANEAECLLDLQEVHLEAQAQEFLNHLAPQA